MQSNANDVREFRIKLGCPGPRLAVQFSFSAISLAGQKARFMQIRQGNQEYTKLAKTSLEFPAGSEERIRIEERKILVRKTKGRDSAGSWISFSFLPSISFPSGVFPVFHPWPGNFLRMGLEIGIRQLT